MVRSRQWILIVALGTATILGLGALVPLARYPMETVFEIPKGTWARRQAGENLEILPQRISLVAGTNLILRNADDVPQIFGPTLIMPGQTLRLPFATPAEYQFACTAHVSGQMTVVVEGVPGHVFGVIRGLFSRFRQS